MDDKQIRLVVTTHASSEPIEDQVGAFLGEHDPWAQYSVGELANPHRANGQPMVVIAVEGLTHDEISAIEIELSKLTSVVESESSKRLHLAVR